MIYKNFIITEENAKEYIEIIKNFIKEKVESANRKGVFLGMSGGIDCSVVARLCQEAGVNIELVMLPDGEDMIRSKSMKDAMELINKFGFNYRTINIKDICDEFESKINENLNNLSKINIRPRTRMIILYSLAQNNHSFVIGTGNLDERLLGYFTKWGDGSSDLNPLGMLTKGEVRILARHLEVPESIINKAPSAGLYEGQTDEDELGFTYEEIDKYILNGTTGNIDTDKKLEKRITMSSHKLEPISIFEGKSLTLTKK